MVIKDRIVFEGFLQKDALTFSTLLSLFTGKFPGSYFESHEYISHFPKEFITYERALEAIHGGRLPAIPDPHIERKYWIMGSDLGQWNLWLLRSALQPCQHMIRFLKKHLKEQPKGIPSVIVQLLIEHDPGVRETLKVYRDTRDD